MTEAMREQFEAAMREVGYLFTRDGDDYLETSMKFAWRGYQAALRSPAVAGLVEALRKSNEALEAIAGEMTVGDRFTNAGQFLLDAIPMCTAALAPFTTGAGHER